MDNRLLIDVIEYTMKNPRGAISFTGGMGQLPVGARKEADGRDILLILLSDQKLNINPTVKGCNSGPFPDSNRLVS